MTTELCKRLDGTTCGRNVDKESSEVGWSHVGDATSPAGPDCTAPPVCWTCGKPIFWDEPDDWKHRSTPGEFLRNEHHSPADGTKPKPGQERCRRQKATECAQGRARYVMDEAYFPLKPWLHLDDDSLCLGPECEDRRVEERRTGSKPEPGQEWCKRKKATECAQGRKTEHRYDHNDGSAWSELRHVDDRPDGEEDVPGTGSPCLGPECKAHPSTGGQIIEQRERVRDAEASAALAANSERDGTGSKREPGIVKRCRATAANVQAWAVGKPPDSLRATVMLHLREAAARIEGLEQDLVIAEKFHKVAVSERDFERVQNQRLREAVQHYMDNCPDCAQKRPSRCAFCARFEEAFTETP